MHYTPEEMTHFVKDYLGPQLEKDGKGRCRNSWLRPKQSRSKKMG